VRAPARHRGAFEQMSRAWSVLERLAQQPQEAKVAAVPDPARAPRRRKWHWPAAAAAVLVAALGGALWMTRRPGTQILSTAVGQERHVTLADGSRLTLNTNTLLAVSLTPGRREIYLRRGEAHFDVVHDPARPFLVHAGDAVIRDIGTQFEVRLHSDRDVDVLVDQGQVEVQGAAAGSAGASHAAAGWQQALRAGERLVIAGPRLSVLNLSPRQLADKLAWCQGALIFESEPLSRAVAEVGRYTRARIVVNGAGVGSLRISGRFRTNDVPGFFQALQAALPVRVTRPEPGLVDIAPR
jgi:transmembrane sensor